MKIKVKFLDPSCIEDLADCILSIANEEGFYDFNSPTPLDLIAEIICGLNIIFEDLDKDFKGILGIIDVKTKAIWLDDCLNHFETKLLCDEGRCNFTIAHEIGHYFLHADLFKQGNIRAFHNELSEQSSKIETQADMFAARLLMPRELVHKKWNKDFSSINNHNERITAMINFFRTSREAMQYRLDKLGLL